MGQYTKSPTKTKVPLRLLIAASGSGGHLLPARYIAEAVRAQVPDVQLLFVGSGRPLEEKLLDAHGFARAVVPIGGLRRRGLTGVLQWGMQLPSALFRTIRIVRAFAPDVIVGVGGYVSVLPVLCGTLRRIPTVLHEAEREAGWANRFLAYVASKVSLAWPDADLASKSNNCVATGQPMRPELLSADFGTKTAPSTPRRMLVLGGSQGARPIDKACTESAAWFANEDIHIRHQCRPESIAEIQSAYQQAGVTAEVVAFIERMEEALAWADIVVTRAGAGAMRELIVCGRPAVLLPLGGSPEQHANANVLVQRRQGVVLDESSEVDSPLAERLQNNISLVFKDYSTYLRPPEQSADSNAAELIARIIIDLAK